MRNLQKKREADRRYRERVRQGLAGKGMRRRPRRAGSLPTTAAPATTPTVARAERAKRL